MKSFIEILFIFILVPKPLIVFPNRSSYYDPKLFLPVKLKRYLLIQYGMNGGIFQPKP